MSNQIAIVADFWFLNLGYALLGMICFGDVSEKFGDLSETLRTLFSVVNGDIIYDTFYSVDFAGLGGQIYLYLYTLIFTYGEFSLIRILCDME